MAHQILSEEYLYELVIFDSCNLMEFLTEFTKRIGTEADTGITEDGDMPYIFVNYLSDLFLYIFQSKFDS